MICKECNANVPEGAVFCPNCGAMVDEIDELEGTTLLNEDVSDDEMFETTILDDGETTPPEDINENTTILEKNDEFSDTYTTNNTTGSENKAINKDTVFAYLNTGIDKLNNGLDKLNNGKEKLNTSLGKLNTEVAKTKNNIKSKKKSVVTTLISILVLAILVVAVVNVPQFFILGQSKNYEATDFDIELLQDGNIVSPGDNISYAFEVFGKPKKVGYGFFDNGFCIYDNEEYTIYISVNPFGKIVQIDYWSNM